MTLKLIEAKRVIEAGWTTGAYSRNYGGKNLHCALGAVDKVLGLAHFPVVHGKMIKRLNRAIPQSFEPWRRDSGARVVAYNDSLGSQAEAVEWFERAINGERCVEERNET